MHRAACQLVALFALLWVAFPCDASFVTQPYTVVDLYTVPGATVYTAVGGQVGGIAGNRPVVWGTDGTSKILATGYPYTGAVYGIAGAFQVGFVSMHPGQIDAWVWEGVPDYGFDLGFQAGGDTIASAASGSPNGPQIVGYSLGGSALLWNAAGPYFSMVVPDAAAR